MGHKVGSLTLHAGVAGGADIILIPEIPYDIKKVTAAIQKRAKAGKRFTILAVAEGAISKEDAELPKKKYKEKLEARAKKYPSVSYEIADQIYKRLEAKSALQFRDIHSEAENHVRMTVFFPQESVQVQRRRSWMVNMAS